MIYFSPPFSVSNRFKQVSSILCLEICMMANNHIMHFVLFQTLLVGLVQTDFEYGGGHEDDKIVLQYSIVFLPPGTIFLYNDCVLYIRLISSTKTTPTSPPSPSCLLASLLSVLVYITSSAGFIYKFSLFPDWLGHYRCVL